MKNKTLPIGHPISFSFRIYNKKHFTQKPLKSSKSSTSTIYCWCSHFCTKMGFCVKCFFLYIRNEKENGKAPRAFCSSPIYVLFFTKKNYIHGAEGWGLFSWKIVNNWTMSRSSFCRYIFPEEWSNNNNVFFRSAIEGLCNVIFMFLVNT